MTKNFKNFPQRMESFVYFFDFVFAAVVVLAAGLMVHQAVMYDMIVMGSRKRMDYQIAKSLLKPIHCLNLYLLSGGHLMAQEIKYR